ncbi:MAG: hypothetical protein H7175_12145, partial [Burkholderiales bacterium]|nr:hypothetical protein [Anaerolineae bacterium]
HVDWEREGCQTYQVYFAEWGSELMRGGDDSCPFVTLATNDSARMQPGEWATVNFQIFGDTIVVTLNNDVIFEVTDSSIANGQLELAAMEGTVILIDDVRVVELVMDSDSAQSAETADADEAAVEYTEADMLLEADFEGEPMDTNLFYLSPYAEIVAQDDRSVLQITASDIDVLGFGLGVLDWTNYEVETRIQVSADTPANSYAFALNLRADWDRDGCQQYQLYFADWGAEIQRGGDDSCPYTTLQSTEDIILQPGQWYTVSAELFEESIVVYVDGEEIFRLNDDVVSSGYVNVSADEGTQVNLDDIRVTELVAAATP